jgi:hypothetical protein
MVLLLSIGDSFKISASSWSLFTDRMKRSGMFILTEYAHKAFEEITTSLAGYLNPLLILYLGSEGQKHTPAGYLSDYLLLLAQQISPPTTYFYWPNKWLVKNLFGRFPTHVCLTLPHTCARHFPPPPPRARSPPCPSTSAGKMTSDARDLTSIALCSSPVCVTP